MPTGVSTEILTILLSVKLYVVHPDKSRVIKIIFFDKTMIFSSSATQSGVLYLESPHSISKLVPQKSVSLLLSSNIFYMSCQQPNKTNKYSEENHHGRNYTQDKECWNPKPISHEISNYNSHQCHEYNVIHATIIP